MSSTHRCPTCGQVIPDKKALTKRQAEVFAFLRERITADGYSPSLQEIADHFGWGSLANVHDHLGHLERKGHIRREYHASRSITLVEQTDA